MLDWNVTLNILLLILALVSSLLIGGLVVAVLLLPRIRRLRKLLCIDDLTQLYNSKAFNRRMTLELKRAGNSSRSLSLVLMDINQFKRLNDTYGYKSGDLVLTRFAGLLKSRVRHLDLVFRYKQGDEFAILMIETDVAEAESFVGKLQEELRSHEFPITTGPQLENFVCVTLSAGIAVFDANTDTVASLAERAELALRDAKQSAKHGLSTLTSFGGPTRGKHVNGTLDTAVRN